MNRRRFRESGALLTGALLCDGRAFSATNGREFRLGNSLISGTWTTRDGQLIYAQLRDGIAGRAIPLPSELFSVTLQGGAVLGASEFTITSGPFEENLIPVASARLSDRLQGVGLRAELLHRDKILRATWRAVLRQDSPYLRQELELEAIASDVQVTGVKLFDFLDLPDAFVYGNVDGSPIVSGTLYAAIEHPLATSEAIYDRASATLPRRVPLRAGVPLRVSSVLGVSAPGQLRRDFLNYVERERAHPYRTFLHYNSWYDIGYFTRYDQRQCLDRIHAFGEKLSRERNVRLSSFLFDDGWDDPNDLWHFNSGFPDGFAPLKTAAAAYGAAPGAWLSPWGGYGNPREQRLANAKAQGYEINEDGLALSGPKYNALFEDVVMRFIKNGGVNQFKLDGTGNSSSVFPGSRYGSDFEAAIALIEGMREAEPDLYVNLTTGTYPSPFWLWYCDSIWRGGDDHNFFGAGTHRQKWITYRDADTYEGIVSQGPLFPLNSVMLHGLIFAQYAKHLNDDPNSDFSSEVHSYFATGTQLQEMYCTPSLLSERNWNDIARAAKWSAANAAVLRDTHWIGGNPYRLDVYGWAAWTPARAIITVRNPSDRTQEYPLDVRSALELPEDAPREYVAGTNRLFSGREALLTLAPFEVRTLVLHPVRT